MFIRESATLAVENPVVKDLTIPIKEGIIADLKLQEVRAIYPLIRAINSGRLTRNYTFYPAASLTTKGTESSPAGFTSFVKPYGKPILREHQSQNIPGLLGNIEEADVPMGRIIYAGYQKRKEAGNPPAKKFMPGTHEGDGSLYTVPAITCPEAIVRVLGGAYHTVSIGCNVEDVFESISGKNLAELRRRGEELPDFERGQLYEGKLSYWSMGAIAGEELSFVNVPSDVMAAVETPDIGSDGIRLLVAEKKSGKTKEYNFFDALTQEKVLLDIDESAWDESFFTDSANVGHNIWWLDPNRRESMPTPTEVKESTPDLSALVDPEEETQEEESEVQPEEPTVKPTEESSTDNLLNLSIEELQKKREEILKLYAKTDLLSKEDLSDLVKGEHKFEILEKELFAEVTKLAFDLTGGWDEKAAAIAYNMYVSKGGKVKGKTEVKFKKTLKEFYCLSEDHPLAVNTKEFISSEKYFGEDQTFPVGNLNEALIAVEAVKNQSDELKEKVWAEVKNLGFADDIGLIVPTIIYTPKEGNLVPLFTVRNSDEFAVFQNNIEILAKQYSIDEANVNKAKEQKDPFNISKEYNEFNPVFLSEQNLINFVLNSESPDNRKELVTLVGLARRLNLTKDTLDEAFNAYSVFSNSVLEFFLKNVPSVIPEETIAEEASLESTPIVQISESTVEEIPEPAKKKESNNVWLGIKKVKPKGNPKRTN